MKPPPPPHGRAQGLAWRAQVAEVHDCFAVAELMMYEVSTTLSDCNRNEVHR
jgi:hypothetical protein